MNEKQKKKISKFLSLILRHQPEAVGLTLEENGWVEVDKLLQACDKNGSSFSRKELEEVVETNDKTRFSFDETKTKIRANQGHSIEIEIEFEKKTPPEILYHGTAERNVDRILAEGLKKMARHHVHLSADIETATKVGIRYGKPVILEVDTKAMTDEGFEFFVSANGVWLIDNVPPQFLSVKK